MAPSLMKDLRQDSAPSDDIFNVVLYDPINAILSTKSLCDAILRKKTPAINVLNIEPKSRPYKKE